MAHATSQQIRNPGPVAVGGGIGHLLDASDRGAEFVFGSLAGVCLALGIFPQVVLDSLRADVSVLGHIGDAARRSVRTKNQAAGIAIARAAAPRAAGLRFRRSPAARRRGADRAHSSVLTSAAVRVQDVTDTNTSPANAAPRSLQSCI